jgi:hypothetical protein
LSRGRLGHLQTRRDYLRNRSIIIIAVVEANLSEKNLLAPPELHSLPRASSRRNPKTLPRPILWGSGSHLFTLERYLFSGKERVDYYARTESRAHALVSSARFIGSFHRLVSSARSPRRFAQFANFSSSSRYSQGPRPS